METPTVVAGAKVVPQLVLWAPSDRDGSRLRVFTTENVEERWIGSDELKAELNENLLPQMFAKNSGEYSFAISDYHGKKDWLMFVVDDRGQQICDVWLGKDPEKGWEWDGMVRVGDGDHEPYVWQVYQRYSDGTYRRLRSKYRSIDGMRKPAR